jgi:hypothetical protein
MTWWNGSKRAAIPGMPGEVLLGRRTAEPPCKGRGSLAGAQMYLNTCDMEIHLERQSRLVYDMVMVAPCPKCGATKTETGSHDLTYRVAKLFGYRVRLCSRCRRRRFLPRHSESSAEAAEENKHTAESSDAEVERKPRGPNQPWRGCPRCGKIDYRRSHRRLWERLAGRGPMVRCRNCRFRFPLPEGAPREWKHDDGFVNPTGAELGPRPHKSR